MDSCLHLAACPFIKRKAFSLMHQVTNALLTSVYLLVKRLCLDRGEMRPSVLLCIAMARAVSVGRPQPRRKMNGCQWKIEFRGSSPQSRFCSAIFYRNFSIKVNDSEVCTYNFLSASSPDTFFMSNENIIRIFSINLFIQALFWHFLIQHSLLHFFFIMLGAKAAISSIVWLF